ncbi:probable UDP-3-O-acyl-N-acetylglucosamine deacetylase 2, mitochondrial isoform X1 [Tanacetum coccineum]
MFHLSDSSRNGRKSQGYEDTKYLMKRQKQTINGLIEEALLESEAKGVKGEELNKSGSELAGKGRYFDFGTSFIPASIEYAKEVTPLCTTLFRDGWSVRTVEHFLSALEGTSVNNCRIEIVSSHHNDTPAEVFDGVIHLPYLDILSFSEDYFLRSNKGHMVPRYIGGLLFGGVTVMSSASSAVTYTSVHTDSEPGKAFWGADEEIVIPLV